MFGFFCKFFSEIAEEDGDVESGKHHVGYEADYHEETNSLPAHSRIVLVHERSPVLVEEQIKNAEEGGREGLEVVDEGLASNVHLSAAVEPNLKSEEQLCGLLEHDGEAQAQQQKGLDFQDSFCEDKNDLLLVNKDPVAYVERPHQPNDFQTAKDQSYLGLTVDDRLAHNTTDDQIHHMEGNCRQIGNVQRLIEVLLPLEDDQGDNNHHGGPAQNEVQ